MYYVRSIEGACCIPTTTIDSTSFRISNGLLRAMRVLRRMLRCQEWQNLPCHWQRLLSNMGKTRLIQLIQFVATVVMVLVHREAVQAVDIAHSSLLFFTNRRSSNRMRSTRRCQNRTWKKRVLLGKFDVQRHARDERSSTNCCSRSSSRRPLCISDDSFHQDNKEEADQVVATMCNNASTSLNPALLFKSSSSNSSLASTTATPIVKTNNEYSFYDEATIYIRAGSGGQGSSTYKRGVNNQRGPPDGGNGGKGGNVLFILDESLNTLAGLARDAWRPNSFGGVGRVRKRSRTVQNTPTSDSSIYKEGDFLRETVTVAATARLLSFRAENGAEGGRNGRNGRNGKDIIVRVPPGTVIQEEILPASNDACENKSHSSDDLASTIAVPTYFDMKTVTFANPTYIAATGGQGGEGSLYSAAQRGGAGHRPRSPPQRGERKRLKLTLKVIADLALVAVPNAGKSTLLNRVTRAKPKIADYPFTTVIPNLGVWVPKRDFASFEDDSGYIESDQDDLEGGIDNTIASKRNTSLIICDVPGLIAGASEGVGLGHAFLRHVERCHVILHLLDATSQNILEDYAMINRELLNYGTGKLALMPQVVVVNKVDIAFGGKEGIIDTADAVVSGKYWSQKELEENLKKVVPHTRIMWISAKEGEGVDDLMERVALFVKKVKEVSVV